MLTRLAVCLFSALPVAALAAPESFTLDPIHSFPYFGIDHLGLSTIHGRFEKMTGKVTFDRAAKTGSIEIAIPSATVNTGDQDKGSRPRSRDDHLRTADFFNVAEFPQMTYKSSKVSFNGDNPASVDGELTLLGVTKPVTLTIVRFKCNPASGNNKERCGGDATGKFKRSDFGMKTGVPNIGDEVTLMIGFEGNKE
ncbi:MAG: YceI family protein [Pseudomonadota bacterium]|nr:YceI family protein [Pseudomonadota bacterium]